MKSVTIAAAIGVLIALAPLTDGRAFLIDPMGPKAGSVTFSGADLQFMRSHAVELLERARPGETRRWSNQKSGNSGTLRLIDVYRSRSRACGRILHRIKFKGFKDPRSFVIPYCKNGGRWRNAMR